ncbi:MAG: hypothetical protein MSA30_03330 [Prevotella sp.]|nr:hypothetical protein [Prevotella sp.]
MTKNISDKHYVERDISWMYFNHRILQEAEKESVPTSSCLRQAYSSWLPTTLGHNASLCQASALPTASSTI